VSSAASDANSSSSSGRSARRRVRSTLRGRVAPELSFPARVSVSGAHLHARRGIGIRCRRLRACHPARAHPRRPSILRLVRTRPSRPPTASSSGASDKPLAGSGNRFLVVTIIARRGPGAWLGTCCQHCASHARARIVAHRQEFVRLSVHVPLRSCASSIMLPSARHGPFLKSGLSCRARRRVPYTVRCGAWAPGRYVERKKLRKRQENRMTAANTWSRSRAHAHAHAHAWECEHSHARVGLPRNAAV
jgi:hypothetical protein